MPSTPCSAKTTSRRMSVSDTVPGLEPSDRAGAREAAAAAAVADTSGIEAELGSLPTPSASVESAGRVRSGVAVAD